MYFPETVLKRELLSICFYALAVVYTVILDVNWSLRFPRNE